jgi:MFS family permease
MPNIVLPFIAGVVLDKVGSRISIVVFCGLLLLGQVIATIGSATHGDGDVNIGVMLAGRVIFGFGSEALFVAISNILLLKTRHCHRYLVHWKGARNSVFYLECLEYVNPIVHELYHNKNF